jgi:hypothetical protein
LTLSLGSAVDEKLLDEYVLYMEDTDDDDGTTTETNLEEEGAVTDAVNRLAVLRLCLDNVRANIFSYNNYNYLERFDDKIFFELFNSNFVCNNCF